MAKKKPSKSKALTESRVRAELDKHGLAINIGDLYVDDRGYVVRVEGFKRSRDGKVTVDVASNHFGAWAHYGDIELVRFKRGEYLRLDKPYAEAKADALEALKHPEAFDLTPDENVSETALVLTNADRAASLHVILEEKRNRVEVIRRLAASQLGKFQSISNALREQMDQVSKVIHVFELYLGVNEEITELRGGTPAPIDEPISIRQMVLYMDEEAGDPRVNKRTEQMGIDFQSVDDFDRWLLAGNHLDQVLPEPKGMVAICPSRQERSYSDNAWINSLMQQENKMTYLLIRNGQQVYRVWTSLQMGKRLFAEASEMERLLQTIEEGSNYSAARDAKDADLVYKRNAVVMQGLIDRTPVFLPLPVRVNLFDPSHDGVYIRLIRDAEMLLESERERYAEWHARINAQIKVGSRVFVASTNDYWRFGKEFVRDRLVRYYETGRAPYGPSSGIYQVMGLGDPGSGGKRPFLILYNPGDEVWYGSGWRYDPHPRKQRLSFRIKPDDEFVLNYDQIEPDDVTHYIGSRIERAHYLDMLPALYGVQEALQAEVERERLFVSLLSGKWGYDEAEVWTGVNWWKLRNTWKRPLAQDDDKALRMIRRWLAGAWRKP